jgi:hypothetical protein
MRLLSLARMREPTRRALYRFYRDLGDAAPAAGLLFLADILATRPVDAEPQWTSVLAVVGRTVRGYFTEPNIANPQPLVNGRELMEALGVQEGPVVGHLIETIREAQAAGSVRTRAQALACASRVLQRWRRSQHDSC